MTAFANLLRVLKPRCEVFCLPYRRDEKDRLHVRLWCFYAGRQYFLTRDVTLCLPQWPFLQVSECALTSSSVPTGELEHNLKCLHRMLWPNEDGNFLITWIPS